MRSSYPAPEGREHLIWWRIYTWGWEQQTSQPRYCSEVNIQMRGAVLNTFEFWRERING